VEFVLLAKPDGLWVTVGSDHTDRKAETIGVSLSKQLCAKVIAKDAWRYDQVKPHWEEARPPLVVRRRALPGGAGHRDALAGRSAFKVPLETRMAMFCGTLAANGGIRPAKVFRMELEDPVRKRSWRTNTASHRCRSKADPLVSGRCPLVLLSCRDGQGFELAGRRSRMSLHLEEGGEHVLDVRCGPAAGPR